MRDLKTLLFVMAVGWCTYVRGMKIGDPVLPLMGAGVGKAEGMI